MTSTVRADFSAQDVKQAFIPLIPHRKAAERILDILETGRGFRYEGGPEESDASMLEVKFAKLVGMRYAVALNSCSSAILIALKTLQFRGIDISKVLVTAFTFTAVPGAIANAGAQPVFVNIDEDLKIDLGDLRTKARASGAKVLLLSHMRGYISDMDAIAELCDAEDIALVEDAAHALGATWRANAVGTFGTVNCFSFQDYKILKAGEGGMLVTDDQDIAAVAILFSGAYERNYRFHHGIAREVFEKYAGRVPPYNFRYSELQAACVLAQLEDLEMRVETYRELYGRVVRKLKAASNLFVFPTGDVRERRAPDSLQFRIPTFTAEQMRAFVAEVEDAGFPLTCIGTGAGNARHPANWNYLEKDVVQGLEPTTDILATLCDMRLPFTLDDELLDYAADVFGQAARLAEHV